MKGSSYIYLLILLPTFCTAESFDYGDQNSWGGDCNSDAKIMQSPVDINTKSVVRGTKLSALKFDARWSNSSQGQVSNTGATVMFNPEDSPELVIDFLGNYSLKLVHFHWGPTNGNGSEHRIDGKQADMEIHFGAIKKGGNDKERDYYAVLGVLADESKEKSMTGVWEKIKVADVQQTRSTPTNVSGIVINDLLPSDLSYYYYPGSFTTPNCSEIVQWFVMKERITVPSEFLKQLRLVQDKSGNLLSSNIRKDQPLNDRVVMMEGSQVIHKPTVLIVLLTAFIVKFLI